ncbi:uncharacterized protein MKK02DRAFT_40860 [Dioszegia hungarica]|uniref:DUF6534 domain-containing protein n=1 Tax=Dioszegia hungarica TaxID=4972 RepID=A0AA38H2B9_9TREE|nr:uncharacterized protein MKK02DRAFT_40860 [Dioszegia hungarica]KAI9632555.1 hypothetical protein MKK02DRAFT_40860 [Dioszegia hungarica]
MSLAGASPAQLALAEAIAERYITSNRALRILPYYLDDALLGVVLCHSLSYLRFVRTDKKHIVVLVVLSVLTTLAASIDVMLWLTNIFVSQLWKCGLYMIIDAIGTALVQIFYVDRAYRLHRHWWPLAVLCPLVLGTIAAWATLVQFMGRLIAQGLDPTTMLTPAYMTVANATLSLIMVTDLAITAVVIYGLQKNKTGWKHTDSHLKGLVIKCFEAQIPALIIAILILVFWTIKIEIATCILMFHTKVYVAGLLVTLNFRSTPGATSIGQSYESNVISEGHVLSDISGKNINNSVLVQRDTETISHQAPPYYSKRHKVMDAEEGSSHSDQPSLRSHSTFHHPFAQHDPAGWESTVALQEPHRSRER